jgi:carbohydrate-selective porin OprB
VSANTTRLDSWWIEKRWLGERIAVRVGQFAGQDFYGNGQYGTSFIISPMNYALGNLFTTFETFNPFATPAAEIRIAPIDHFYLTSMVMAGDPSPATQPTGFGRSSVGSPVVVSEIGFIRVGSQHRRPSTTSRAERIPSYQFGGLQSRRLHGAAQPNASVGQLSPVLEGEPGALARRSERSTGPRCDVYARLESAECQSQLHAAHGGAALQRAAASGFS